MQFAHIARLCAVALGLACTAVSVGAQQFPAPPTPTEAAGVRETIASMKANERGPYERIRWFCADGSVHPPQGSPCSTLGGGVQHAEPNAAARGLAELGYHVGTIFQATPYESFADEERAGFRLREIVLERYLVQADDGWVLRRARYYRGALQIEDEERSGRALLERRLGDSEWLRANYLLASRLAVAVPHETPGADRLMDRIRAMATEIALAEPDFQRIRVRIHSLPSRADVDAVESYMARGTLADSVQLKLTSLRDDLVAQYDPGRALASLASYERIAPESLREPLAALRMTLESGDAGKTFERIVALAPRVRAEAEAATGSVALDLVDLGLSLQERAFVLASQLEADAPAISRTAALGRFRQYVQLGYAAGYLSSRERDALVEEARRLVASGEPTAGAYKRSVTYLGRSLDWGRGTVRATFGPAIDRYALVEPVSTTFSDALLRGSVLLPLSRLLDDLHADADIQLGATHSLFGTTVSSGLRGLNPGAAMGELDVLEADAHEDVHADRIYLLPETPPELKPVAGVLTLAEGNLLSHVQLLARNLGIPNATVAPEHEARLRAARGRPVFYAVTPMGRVIVADPDALGDAERALVARDATASPTTRMRLDTSRLRLDVRQPLPLEQLRSTSSGVTVGPKAANLGQLAADFPGRVSDAVALPFGMFVEHVDRPYGDTGRTVLEELQAAYGRAAAMRARGAGESEIDAFMLERLAWVRQAIEGLPWLPAQRDLILEELGGMLEGDFSRGVFVRSDTNVEDLPQFSGAGLNLTVAHQTSPDAVLASIKRVWTSPFSERAYLWRRQILEEQGEVYPSVLLQQTVPSEKSGVLITSGIQEGRPEDLTVVAAEGVGGAVEGEDAETLLLLPGGGVRLLSQTKAPRRREVVMGGTRWVAARRPDVLLQPGEIEQLRAVVDSWRARTRGTEDAETAWDIEYGFLDGRLWLFQIRPFVRFRNSETYARLEALDAAATANQERPVPLSAIMERS